MNLTHTLFINRIRLNERMEIPRGEFPFALPCVRGLDVEFRKPVTFLVGENGSGKSTILEGIVEALGINLEGGNKNYRFNTAGEHSALSDYLVVSRGLIPDYSYFFRAETMYNVFTYEDGMFRDLPPHKRPQRLKMSHGEGFFDVLKSLRESGLYILDEPESALSPQRLFSLLALIRQLVDAGCQFIVSTHSPILAAYPDADILQLSDEGIERVDYENTDLYRTYKSFLDNRELYLRLLLSGKTFCCFINQG